MIDKLRAPFPRDRIHWRAQTVTRDGSKALALAYLDARDVRHRLNEVVGPENWTCEHYDCGGGKLGCRLSIRIDGEWITKTDGAGDTQVEAEKGAFSSALKRAAVAWGVGEYLYDMDAVWVPCESYERNGKKMFSKFTADPWACVREPSRQEPRQDNKSGDGVTDLVATIKAGIAEARTLADLATFWTSIETEADLRIVRAEDQKAFHDLVQAKEQRKAQVADGHQIDHAKEQAA